MNYHFKSTQFCVDQFIFSGCPIKLKRTYRILNFLKNFLFQQPNAAFFCFSSGDQTDAPRLVDEKRKFKETKLQ